MGVREHQPEGTGLLLKVGGGSAERRPRLLDFIEAREWVYGAVFGDYDYVYPGRAALKPRIDVYRFPPTARRPFFTFVTAGMSDLPMHSPAELGADCRRWSWCSTRPRAGLSTRGFLAILRISHMRIRPGSTGATQRPTVLRLNRCSGPMP